jgi:hypothetical protein
LSSEEVFSDIKMRDIVPLLKIMRPSRPLGELSGHPTSDRLNSQARVFEENGDFLWMISSNGTRDNDLNPSTIPGGLALLKAVGHTTFRFSNVLCASIASAVSARTDGIARETAKSSSANNFEQSRARGDRSCPLTVGYVFERFIQEKSIWVLSSREEAG